METKAKASGIKWHEESIDEQMEERLHANRMKIDEPKTPFHRLEEDGEEPCAYPPKAAAAKPGGPLRPESGGLPIGQDMFAKIAAAAEERQAADEGPGEDEEGAHSPRCARCAPLYSRAWHCRSLASQRSAQSSSTVGRITTRSAASRSCARRRRRWTPTRRTMISSVGRAMRTCVA